MEPLVWAKNLPSTYSLSDRLDFLYLYKSALIPMFPLSGVSMDVPNAFSLWLMRKLPFSHDQHKFSLFLNLVLFTSSDFLPLKPVLCKYKLA